jgi:hypothetical protein
MQHVAKRNKFQPTSQRASYGFLGYNLDSHNLYSHHTYICMRVHIHAKKRFDTPCEQKGDMCPCDSDLWWVIVNVIHVPGWVYELTVAWVGLCDMSLASWCPGVELGGSGRWRGEGQVGTCRADGPGAVKNGREAWTEGPGGWVTSHGGWHLGTSTSTSVHGGVIVLTESRWRTCKSSGGSRRLGGRAVKDEVTRFELQETRMEYATHGRFGGLSLKTTRWTVSRVWPQNPGEGSEEERGSTWRNHRGCIEAKQICAASVAVRLTEKELDHSALRLGVSL